MTRAPNASELVNALREIVQSLPRLISDRVLLLSLEMRRASHALAVIAACVVLTAICLATAWIALWTGISMALVKAGFAPHVVAAGVLIVNALAGLIALWWAYSQIHLLALPATVRQLTIAHPSERRDDVGVGGDAPIAGKS